jgi:hypothetical protein
MSVDPCIDSHLLYVLTNTNNCAHPCYLCACRCIEVPCPKPGRSHGLGWEHMEVVIGEDGDHCAESHHRLHEFVAKHPGALYNLIFNMHIFMCIYQQLLYP